MIISNKNVNFIIEDDNLTFSFDIKLIALARYSLLVKSFRKSTTSPVVAGLFEKMLLACVKKDGRALLTALKRIIEQKFIDVLREHSEIISSDNFNIHVQYRINNSFKALAAYLSDLSGANEAYFIFNLSRHFVVSAIREGEKFIEKNLAHELFHHSDIKKSVQVRRIKVKVKEIIEKNSIIREAVMDEIKSEGMQTVFKVTEIFILLRNEGLAAFFEDFNNSKKIDFNPKFLNDVKMTLRIISEYYNEEEIASYEDVFNYYKVGAMMTSIITLHHLFGLDKKSSASIISGFFLKKEINAEKIGEFFGKVKFQIYFKDKDAYGLVYGKLNKLKTLSHIGFLKEYESACNYFGIKDNIINLRMYNEYKKKSWINFQKLKLSYGFKK